MPGLPKLTNLCVSVANAIGRTLSDLTAWMLAPELAPWSGTNESLGKLGAGKFLLELSMYPGLIAIYVWGNGRFVYFKDDDSSLATFYLVSALLPIIVSVTYQLLPRGQLTVQQSFLALTWIYRAWAFQLVLLFVWARILTVNNVERDLIHFPYVHIYGNFNVAVVVCALVVGILLCIKMRKAGESWINVLAIVLMYGVCTLLIRVLHVPPLPKSAYWWMTS